MKKSKIENGQKGFNHKMYVKFFMFIAVWLILTGIVLADDRPGALFLTIPPSAKTLGMGTSCMGSCDDPTSIHYNPGSLGFYDKFCLTITNQGLPPGCGRLLEEEVLALGGRVVYGEVIPPEPAWLGGLVRGMRYISGSCVTPLTKKGNLGFNCIYLTTGKIDVIDANGKYRGSYETYDIAPGVAFSRRFFDRLGLGITAKYIYSYLVPRWVLELMPELGAVHGTASSVALDMGALYKIWGFGAGLSLQNLGLAMDYGNGLRSRLPMRIRGGVSLKPVVAYDSLFAINASKILNVTFNYDLAYDPHDWDNVWRCSGWEFTLLKVFSYRHGSWNWWGRASKGFGLNLRNIEIDVARYFDWNSYHVQLTFHAVPPPENIRSNERLNKILTVASAALAPGGRQFYKGEGLKGSLFMVPAMYLGNAYLTTNSSNTKTLAFVGLLFLYSFSALEAISQ